MGSAFTIASEALEGRIVRVSPAERPRPLPRSPGPESPSAAVMAAFAMVGATAALATFGGCLMACTEAFANRLGFGADGDTLPLPLHHVCGTRIVEELATAERNRERRSTLVKTHAGRPAAMHIVPLDRATRDRLGQDGVLLLLADVGGASVPSADLLRQMFDLTPAEARLARLLVGGRAPAEAARALGITEGTARTHLRRVFEKIGVNRQAELVRLLAGLGAPTPIA